MLVLWFFATLDLEHEMSELFAVRIAIRVSSRGTRLLSNHSGSI